VNQGVFVGLRTGLSASIKEHINYTTDIEDYLKVYLGKQAPIKKYLHNLLNVQKQSPHE